MRALESRGPPPPTRPPLCRAGALCGQTTQPPAELSRRPSSSHTSQRVDAFTRAICAAAGAGFCTRPVTLVWLPVTLALMHAIDILIFPRYRFIYTPGGTSDSEPILSEIHWAVNAIDCKLQRR